MKYCTLLALIGLSTVKTVDFDGDGVDDTDDKEEREDRMNDEDDDEGWYEDEDARGGEDEWDY